MTKDFKQSESVLLREFERALTELFDSLSASVPAPLFDAMAYSVFAGGKRLRPLLCLSACEMLGGEIVNAMPFAVTAEPIQTNNTIHDDLPCMDNDDLRRGRATNHKVFGEGFALLAGDALLNLAYEHLFGNIFLNENNLKAARTIAECAGSRGMIAGQTVDIASENRGEGSLETLGYIHLNKTAKLIRASVLSGAYAAGAGESDISALTEFSDSLGLAFQATDDLLDLTGDASAMGKDTGKDGAKLTYPKLFGAEETANLIRQLTEKAVHSLNVFGDSREPLRSLTLSLCGRRK